MCVQTTTNTHAGAHTDTHRPPNGILVLIESVSGVSAVALEQNNSEERGNLFRGSTTR